MRRCEFANGEILFKKELTYKEYKDIDEQLQRCSLFIDKIKLVTNPSGESVSLSKFSLLNNEYFWEETELALNEIHDIAPIESGVVEYIGDDGKHWRYIYRDGWWSYQNGKVVYDDGGED